MSLRTIPLSQIRESKVALRPVNRNTESYVQLVDSIKQFGVIDPISVRELVDPETKETYFSIINGLHRYTGSIDAGKTEIPAHVMSMDEGRVLEAQIVANIHRVETKPAEYSKQLVKILALNPMMTLTELATRLARSVQWLQDRLSLNNLPEPVQKLVDEGKIVLTNAYALAKLKDAAEVGNFVERAMQLEPEVFVGQVNARVKEIRDAKRQGREAKGEEFQAYPRLQRIGDIKGELDALSQVQMVLKTKGYNDPSHAEVAKATLEWVLHLDPLSVDKARAEFEAQKKAREEKKVQREKDRAQAKATKAAEEAEKANAALSALAAK